MIFRHMLNTSHEIQNRTPKSSTKRKVRVGQSLSTIASVRDRVRAIAKRMPARMVIMMFSILRPRLWLVNGTLLTLLFFALPSYGQNVRWDDQATTTTGVGQLIPVLAIPGASVSFYTGCTALPCTTPAVTFNAPTGSTTCPSNAQVVWQLPIAAGCKSTADSQGNFGGYFSIGAYQFTETISGHVAGPYQFNVGDAGGSATIGGATTANEGVGTPNANNTLAPVPEVGYQTSSGTTSYVCQEDHNTGNWDVRCHGWASNPSTALVNTIQLAMCYYFTQGQSIVPVVHIPSGTYSVGGNISLPPGLDLEGPAGAPYGNSTQLNTSDPTQAMFTQQGSMTFTCNGTVYTASNGTDTIGGVILNGGGSGHAADIGLINATGGTTDAYMHNIGFTNFGGPGRTVSPTASGQDSRGTMIFFAADLQWYYNSGQYNPTGFTDTNVHCSVDLTDLDSQWDHVLGFGNLQDSGFYNRFYLGNVCLAGGQGSWFRDSFLQIAPHNIWYYSGVDGNEDVSGNRLDDSWWDSIHLGFGSSGNYHHNIINGYCTSPTLNPSNFSSNPGGVSTDPACSAIGGEGPDFATGGTEGMLGAKFEYNQFTQDGGVWPFWHVWVMFFPNNVIGQVPSTVLQPVNTLGVIGSSGYIGGALGFNNTQNPGADMALSLYNLTLNEASNTGGTLHFNYYAHLGLQDTSAETFTAFDGLYSDVYVTINIGANDTINPSSTVFPCGGTAKTNVGVTTWWVAAPSLIQTNC